MFKDILENFKENEQSIREQLKNIRVDLSSADGNVSVSASAAGSIINIQIQPEYLKTAETEQIEDELVVLINKTLALAKQKETEAMAELLRNALPPGMADLPGMF